MKRSLLTLNLLASLWLGATNLRAQAVDTSVGNAPEDELIAQGVQLRREHRDAEALLEFRRAYQLRATPRALAQIGLAEQALGSWVQAEADLSQALAAKDDEWIRAHADVLREAVAFLATKLAWVSVRGEAGAVVLLNGERVGSLPMQPLRVVAGTIRLEVRSAGRLPVFDVFEANAGALVVQHVQFAAPPKETSPRPAAATPAKTGGESNTEPRATASMLGWGSLGAASGFLVAGLVAQALHERSAGIYNDDGRCLYGALSRDERCGEYRGQADAEQAIAIGGYVGAAVFGAVSAVLFLTAPSKRADADAASGAVEFAFDAGQSGGRIGLRGAF